MKKLFLSETEVFSAFADLPDVLIQDAKNAISYFIPADELSKFETKSIEQEEDVLTFLIPNGDLVDEINDFSYSEKSSVLIKHPGGNTNYFITQDKMQKYKIKTFEEMEKIIENCLSFVIPTGDELLEDIPNLAPSMLQANTPLEMPIPVRKKA